MSKKIILFFSIFLGIILTFPLHFVFASLQINEVMYDLSGADSVGGKSREWVEIYNPDPTDVIVDASKWRFYDGSGNRTMNGSVDFTVTAGSYVILAGDKATFMSDNPNFSGIVYDTGITSFNNTGATLSLIDGSGTTVDSFAYTSSMGGAGDGNSLQKISGSWTGAVPTPGASNTQGGAQAPSSGGSTSTGGVGLINNYSAPSATDTKTQSKIKTNINTKTLIFSGLPLTLQGVTYGYNKDQLYSGRYFWNFGDGDSKEVTLSGLDKITHTYMYPGEYIVTLEYFMNSFGDVPDATDKVTIKVIPTDITISKVGDEKDFFVELSNNTSYDADLSGWMLASDNKTFTLAKDTIIGSKKKIIISSRITGLTVADQSSLKLLTPEKGVAFDYTNSLVPVVLAPVARVAPPVKVITAQSDSAPMPIKSVEKAQVADLTASAINSDPVKESSSNKIIYVVSILFIGACAGAVYFIRRNKTPSVEGEDYTILEE